MDPVVLVLSDDDDFDDLAEAATLPNLGPLDDDPVAHSSVHWLILRRATSAWDGPSEPQFSTRQISGCSSAMSESMLSTAKPMRKRSVPARD